MLTASISQESRAKVAFIHLFRVAASLRGILGAGNLLTRTRMTTPDYEVTAQLVTFRGATRTGALAKLLTHMSENSDIWESGDDILIQTGYGEGIYYEDAYYATAMKSYKPVTA